MCLVYVEVYVHVYLALSFISWRTWWSSLGPTTCCDLATTRTCLASFRSYGYSKIRNIVMCLVHWSRYHIEYLCWSFSITLGFDCDSRATTCADVQASRADVLSPPPYTCCYSCCYTCCFCYYSRHWLDSCNLKYSLRFSALNLVLLCGAIEGVRLIASSDCVMTPQKMTVSRCYKATTGTHIRGRRPTWLLVGNGIELELTYTSVMDRYIC